MRTTLKHTLAALAALGALMLTGTACTQDDPLGGNNPAGTQLLQLGKVTIAGTTTATRSADAATRSADADGFIGIRKTQFVKNDKLVLTLNDGKGNPNSSTEVTATLSTDGTTWTLLPVKTYFTPGTTVSAIHTPTQIPSGSSGLTTRDVLVTAQPEPLNTNGTPLALTLTHANAMVEVTPPASLTAAGTTYKDLTIYATRSGATDAEALSHVTEGTGTNLRHRTIAPAGATLNSVSLKVNGITYTTTIAGTPTLEANKRYPITLTITGDKLEASVATSTNWEVGGEVNGFPTGYDYYISTAAELEKFRDDVNDRTAAIGVKALQTADIDMKDVADWVPIGANNYFKGSYNGNGYSIKNLTMGGGGNEYLGLFGYIVGSKITGVHLRNCTIKSTEKGNIFAGALVGFAEEGSIITLCSATGSIEINSTFTYAGGLVGQAAASKETDYNHITRCSANVDVTVDVSSVGMIGGFVGMSSYTYYAGCIASGTMTTSSSTCYGFGYEINDLHAIGCIFDSGMTGSHTPVFNTITSIRSCLATGTYNSFTSSPATSNIDNAHLNAMSSTPANATPAAARGLLTTSNVASPIKIKTLHYSATDGYTTDVVERYWFAKGIWKDNGNDLPTIDMSYEGTINPEPIQTGNNVYPVNGYWATAPAGETDTHQWNANRNAIAMASDPCATTDAANKGWKMPFIKDMQEMAGWTGIHDWSQSVSASTRVAVTAEFLTAFPAKAMYWSSTVAAGSSIECAWAIYVGDGDATKARYTPQGKDSENRIRCVQPQKAMP